MMPGCPACVNADCDALSTAPNLDFDLETSIMNAVDRAFRHGRLAAARKPEQSPYRLPPSLRDAA
jgi:hypothetical protein